MLWEIKRTEYVRWDGYLGDVVADARVRGVLWWRCKRMYTIKRKFDDGSQGFGGKIVMWEQMKCHEYGAQTSPLHHQILPCV